MEATAQAEDPEIRQDSRLEVKYVVKIVLDLLPLAFFAGCLWRANVYCRNRGL